MVYMVQRHRKVFKSCGGGGGGANFDGHHGVGVVWERGTPSTQPTWVVLK